MLPDALPHILPARQVGIAHSIVSHFKEDEQQEVTSEFCASIHSDPRYAMTVYYLGLADSSLRFCSLPLVFKDKVCGTKGGKTRPFIQSCNAVLMPHATVHSFQSEVRIFPKADESNSIVFADHESWVDLGYDAASIDGVRMQPALSSNPPDAPDDRMYSRYLRQ